MLKKEKELRAQLHSLIDIVMDEASKNEAFLSNLSNVFKDLPKAKKPKKKKRPKKPVEKVTKQLADPFDIYQEEGQEGLLSWLQTLKLEELIEVISVNGLDPSRLSKRWKSTQKCIDLICERVSTRSQQGTVFLNYDTPENR